MLQDVTAIASLVSAVGIFAAGAGTFLTYMKSRQINKTVDSTRKETNSLVATLSYMRGRQDALLSILKVDPGEMADLIREGKD